MRLIAARAEKFITIRFFVFFFFSFRISSSPIDCFTSLGGHVILIQKSLIKTIQFLVKHVNCSPIHFRRVNPVTKYLEKKYLNSYLLVAYYIYYTIGV